MANGEFKKDAKRLELHVGRTKRLLKEGNSIEEIASILNVGESTVRKYKSWIDQAEENRKRHEKVETE